MYEIVPSAAASPDDLFTLFKELYVEFDDLIRSEENDDVIKRLLDERGLPVVP